MLISIGFTLDKQYSLLVSFPNSNDEPFIAYLKTPVEVARLILTLAKASTNINIAFESSLDIRKDYVIAALQDNS